MSRKLRFLKDTRGSAGFDVAVWATLLVVPLLSAVDLGYYIYQRMQLENAAQVAVQAAWKVCDTPAELPATLNCSGLNTAISAAVQSTSLGTGAAVQGTPSEGYYCANASNVLQQVGTLQARPANCSSVVTGSTDRPGDYLQVQVNYTFTPIFRGVSLSALLPTPITRTAWMRLD